MNSVSKSWSAILIGFLLISFPPAAHADGIDNDVLKKILGSGNATIKPVDDDILRLTTNKDKLIRLEKDAASVIVNNPEHAQVLLDSPRLLIVMPRQPGATSFSVLDGAGNVILHKEIIVSNVESHYVRIRRMCTGGDASCAPTSYFYCPNGCYEVTTMNPGGVNVPPPVAPPGNASANGGANGDDNGQLQAPQNPINTTIERGGGVAMPGGGL